MAVPIAEVSLLEESELAEDTQQQLNHSLQRLEFFLRFLGFFHDSPLSFSLSCLSFLLIAVAAPALLTLFFYCSFDDPQLSSCDEYHVKTFELEILICQVAVAAVSLLCVSRNLRKYGIQKFLFVDKFLFHGNVVQFQQEYIRKIDDFFRMLAIWVFPCLMLKTAREIVRVIFVHNGSLGQSVVIVFILLVSWAYSALIYLAGSSLFSLICNLQVIHFENYRKLLERDVDVSVYIEEHSRLTYHLSRISHRFRMFLILEFLIVTASQFVALLETTGNNETINFINGADFGFSSIVQVVGLIICLRAAAKISHRAQGLASFASRWHALATCSSNLTPMGTSGNVRNLEASNSEVSVVNYSEGDLESADCAIPVMNMEFVSYMPAYLKRQAFVMYLLSNPGGVTLFGWTVNRALMDTIFFIELSVVTFVLGKTISFSTTDP